ncbi:class I SAM-dependent methyltransferase [Jejudonia soesokkakensis]|uniref:Class I SAM-dependent methyltransferase n=1 Tax=Jejudonia soesokkakensis TaxID=1323432 RepID=A0ABW2MTA0_9FLAO
MQKLLKPEVQQFIRTYSEDLSKLAFSGSPFKDIIVQELLQQIESRRKAEKKLPTWFTSEAILYPPKLNLEQTSSEATATYKASIVSGERIADLTGGFGIDSYFFATAFKTVAYYEVNKALSEIAKHNFQLLNRKNISVAHADGVEAIKNKKYDVIYLDPSRRNESKGKVFFLSDCEPNVPEYLNTFFESAPTLLIKTSPMLDIAVGLSELQHVCQIHIVALNNEVKEVVWLLKKNPSKPTLVKTINLKNNSEEKFEFPLGTISEAVYDKPSRFLYEPNAAILKSGAFDQLSEAFKIRKLHKHSHLYTSDSLRDFPGRRFVIKNVVPYSKKEMKAALIFKKANITTRNFPVDVSTLRKKWKLNDGGDRFLFFTTLEDEKKAMLICEKI